jgi:hypothetical protein
MLREVSQEAVDELIELLDWIAIVARADGLDHAEHYMIDGRTEEIAFAFEIVVERAFGASRVPRDGVEIRAVEAMSSEFVNRVPHDLGTSSLRELLIARPAGFGFGSRGSGHRSRIIAVARIFTKAHPSS